MLKQEIPLEATCDKDGKTLVLKKGSFVKIIAGSHKGQYSEVGYDIHVKNFYMNKTII